jgi:putative spermidine/putrescine transport system ATP-binding protein
VTATRIALTGLTKRFATTTAVQDLSIEVAAGSFTALLGPSGCGKSTTLSMIAGLLAPDAGDIRFDDASVVPVAAERRDVGLVFQKPLLFPHLTVEQNVAFGLRMRRLDRAESRRRVDLMLERVQLSGLARRRVGELSGGQEQRAALARALVLRPKVLLLDEPFSQLDAALRREMRALVRALHDESAVTTLFVTHDQNEAVEVADSIALLLDGQLAGHGEPERFYTRPPSLAAARFFGVSNEISGHVAAGQFTADQPRPGVTIRATAAVPDGPAVLVIRPEAVQFCQHASPDTVTGVAVTAQFAGTHLDLGIDIGTPRPLRAQQPVGTPICLGRTTHVRLPQQACTVFSLGPSRPACSGADV